jgi:hypothetical protein
VTGQVIKVQGGLAQRLQGWRPLTQVTSDKAWTIDELEAARDRLLGNTPVGVPPFMVDFQG